MGNKSGVEGLDCSSFKVSLGFNQFQNLLKLLPILPAPFLILFLI